MRNFKFKHGRVAKYNFIGKCNFYQTKKEKMNG